MPTACNYKRVPAMQVFCSTAAMGPSQGSVPQHGMQAEAIRARREVRGLVGQCRPFVVRHVSCWLCSLPPTICFLQQARQQCTHEASQKRTADWEQQRRTLKSTGTPWAAGAQRSTAVRRAHAMQRCAAQAGARDQWQRAVEERHAALFGASGRIDWAAYAGLWRRCFAAGSTDASPDDLWGGAAAAKGQQQQRPHADAGTAAGTRAEWQGSRVAAEYAAARAAARGNDSFEATGFGWSPDWGYRDAAWQQAWTQQQHAAAGGGGCSTSGASSHTPQLQQRRPPPAPGASEEERLAWQVEGEMLSLLDACCGDLVRFLGALGIAAAAGGDRRAAWRAAMLRFHPDQLQRAPMREQVAGAVATRLINELWRQEGAA